MFQSVAEAGTPARNKPPRRRLLRGQLFGLGDPALDAAGQSNLFANIVSRFRAKLGDLRVVEDAEVVELLLDRRRNARELLEIVGDAARTGQRLEAEPLFLGLRQILDDRLLGRAEVHAHAALRTRDAVEGR